MSMYTMMKSIALLATLAGSSVVAQLSGPQCGTNTCELTDNCCGDVCAPVSSTCCTTASAGYCEAAETCCGSVCCQAGDVCVADGQCAPANCQNTLAQNCGISMDDITCVDGDFGTDSNLVQNGQPAKFNQKCTSSSGAVNICSIQASSDNIVTSPSCSGGTTSGSSSSSSSSSSTSASSESSTSSPEEATNAGVATVVPTYVALGLAAMCITLNVF